jgi:hypothetical protein
MNINFIFLEMTHLRYYAPLVTEARKRGLKCIFYTGASNKYNCPLLHLDELKKYAQENFVYIRPISEVQKAEGILFINEKTGVEFLDRINPSVKIIATTYQTDFIESFKAYIDKVDHVLMPSKFCAEYYNLTNKKNLYLGIPKYDVKLQSRDILKKYKLKKGKRALLMMPKGRDEAASNWWDISDYLNSLGYTTLFKTRGKDPIVNFYINTKNDFPKLAAQKGDVCFEDPSWFPHTTQELLEVSDVVINFGSTTIEECVMHDTPVINFDIKPAIRNGSKRPYRVTHEYLYNYDYCVQLKTDCSLGNFTAAIEYLTKTDLKKEFKKARKEHLFDHKNCCKKIFDVIL